MLGAGRRGKVHGKAEVVGKISLEMLERLCQAAAVPPPISAGGSVLTPTFPPISLFPQVSSRSPVMTSWIRCNIPE